MSGTRKVLLLALPWIAGTVVTAGCTAAGSEGLLVNVQTDFAPVVEFDLVRVRLDDAPPQDVPVRGVDRFSESRRVTSFDRVTQGRRHLTVTLLKTGRAVTTRELEFPFSGSYLVNVVLTRSCAGLTCGMGESCFGGRCVPDTCITGTEPSCPRPMCTANSECMTTTACASAQCLAGVCTEVPNPERCASNETCVPGTGCIARPADPDANIPIDAASEMLDAGPPPQCTTAATCADSFDCTDDHCVDGHCQNTPTHSRCGADSMCMPSAAGALPTGCVQTCVPAACAPSGCEQAACVEGACRHTPGCPGGASCCGGSLCSGDCSATPCAGQSAGVVCRAAAGPCDLAEVCDGASPYCPADRLDPGSVCRGSAGPCDVPEMCTGSSTACPPDAFDGGTVCRASAGQCDPLEQCSGASPFCPPDALLNGEVCRLSQGPCDPAEACNGASPSCPPDAFTPAGTVCRPDRGECDYEESCTGSSPACPFDNIVPNGNDCFEHCGIHACTDGVCPGVTCGGALPFCCGDTCVTNECVCGGCGG